MSRARHPHRAARRTGLSALVLCLGIGMLVGSPLRLSTSEWSPTVVMASEARPASRIDDHRVPEHPTAVDLLFARIDGLSCRRTSRSRPSPRQGFLGACTAVPLPNGAVLTPAIARTTAPNRYVPNERNAHLRLNVLLI